MRSNANMARLGHHLVALGLVLLVSGALATRRRETDDETCNPFEETQTNQFAVKWEERPYDPEVFFLDRDIELEWVADWGDDWSLYEAEDVETANDIMSDIKRILDDADMYGDSPMSDPDTQHALKAHVASVFGMCYVSPSAATPAAVPTECNNRLNEPPFVACPENGLWGLNTIRAPAVWSALPGVVNENPSQRVMVIDTGVLRTHQDLAANLVPALTVTAYGGNVQQLPNAAAPTDPAILFHGTHVSGTVFARWNNAGANGANGAAGVVGNALGGNCGCGEFQIINGRREVRMSDACINSCIDYATRSNVRVINLSLGSYRSVRSTPNLNDPQRDLISSFCRNGGLVIIAAGNGENNQGNPGTNIIRPGVTNGNNFFYPATYAADLEAAFPTCIINVANLQRDNVLNRGSNFGDFVQVAAPGTQILSSVATSDTDTDLATGTSMAAPHVAGMATLLFNAFPGATQAQVYRCIVTTATRPAAPNPTVPGQRIAGGIVDLQAAYDCLRGRAECPTTGLPACVDPRSGQPVQQCDQANRFCLNINSPTFVCQYSYRPDGSLCRNPAAGGVTTASLDSFEEFVELSAEEIHTMGLEAEPSAQAMKQEDEPELIVSIQGASEAQQTRRKPPRPARRNTTRPAKPARRNTNANRNTNRNRATTCGQCVNRVCQAATPKWCKAANRRAGTSAAM